NVVVQPLVFHLFYVCNNINTMIINKVYNLTFPNYYAGLCSDFPTWTCLPSILPFLLTRPTLELFGQPVHFVAPLVDRSIPSWLLQVLFLPLSGHVPEHYGIEEVQLP